MQQYLGTHGVETPVWSFISEITCCEGNNTRDSNIVADVLKIPWKWLALESGDTQWTGRKRRKCSSMMKDWWSRFCFLLRKECGLHNKRWEQERVSSTIIIFSFVAFTPLPIILLYYSCLTFILPSSFLIAQNYKTTSLENASLHQSFIGTYLFRSSRRFEISP